MKKRLILIFSVFFVASSSLLNGRFVIANLRFYLFNEPSRVTEDTIPKPTISTDGKARLVRKTNINNDLFERLSAQAILFIPKISVTTPIVFDATADHPSLYKALERGVVNYPLTVKPGENGVSVVLGHSSALPWYPGDYGSIFALLGKLKIGDRFYVQYRDGSTYYYTIKQTMIYNMSSKKENLNNLVNRQKKSMILVSCWPINISYKRIAVEAELVE